MYSDELRMQYECIRRDGQCNMFDANCVAAMALMNGFDELAELAGERKDYAAFLGNYEPVGDEEYRQWLSADAEGGA